MVYFELVLFCLACCMNMSKYWERAAGVGVTENGCDGALRIGRLACLR